MRLQWLLLYEHRGYLPQSEVRRDDARATNKIQRGDEPLQWFALEKGGEHELSGLFLLLFLVLLVSVFGVDECGGE